VFPGTGVAIPVGRAPSVRLAQTLTVGDRICLAIQRDRSVSDPVRADLHDVGTLVRVHRIMHKDDGSYVLMVQGLDRLTLADIKTWDPFLRVDGHRLEEPGREASEAKLLADTLREHIRETIGDEGGALAESIRSDDGPSMFADRVAATLGLEHEQTLEVFLTLDVPKRLRLVAQKFGEVNELRDLRRKIESEIRKGLRDGQREHLLREQIKAIHRELGDDTEEDDLDELRKRLDDAELPEEVRKAADRGLKRLDRLNPANPEHNVTRTYLEWIADIPWARSAEVSDDLDAVEARLDADHYGLEEVKRRILEHMAVLKLSGSQRGTILCLAGPPGVGKTSLGQSIADATGRPFVRMALGGVHDEAELRGHRRTYVGALPGRIVRAFKQAGVNNPVMLLDEVDKLGLSWRGAPESALLEILDPEQNRSFVDHYMELELDLSQVLFICTANDLQQISAPLRDRLEVIEMTGYTPEEKQSIARRHLIPKQLEAHAIERSDMTLEDEALQVVIREYTREAGVRQLEREIKKLCRALALQVARSKDEGVGALRISAENVREHLGKPRFFNDLTERTAAPGVAIGLAWTAVGGDILFVETSRMPGKGNLQITGQLGDVMQESARAALTYVRSNADALGVEPRFLDGHDVHVHVPAGAVPKDGPSAGVTIFTALTSLLTGRRVRPDVAMTGECTLRGRVLPVGGIKAKVLAAHRAGLHRVVLPERNARDLDEVPEDVRESMEFVLVEDMKQVLEAALEPAGPVGDSLPLPEDAAAPQTGVSVHDAA
jgi:ATP-dependent Lon protease